MGWSKRKTRDVLTLPLDLFPEERLIPSDKIKSLTDEGFNFLDPDLIQLRDYQAVATGIILDGKNYGLNLETADGKTIVAFIVADRKIEKGQVILLAPHTALCGQHHERARGRFKKIDPAQINLVTGDTPERLRAGIYTRSKIVIATPQTYLNDLRGGTANLNGVEIIIFDEMHMAAENYAYVPIAQMAHERGIQILGLTASAGGTREKINRVKENLHIHSWLKPPSSRWRQIRDPSLEIVSLGEELEEAKDYLWALLNELYLQMVELGITSKSFPILSERDLREMRGRIRRDIETVLDDEIKYGLYRATSILASYYKVVKLLTYLVTESCEEFVKFALKVEQADNQAGFRILGDPLFAATMAIVGDLMRRGIKHPKQQKALDVLGNLKPYEKAIVFARYILSNRRLAEILNEAGIRSVSLVGKSEIPTKKQLEIIESFGRGNYQVMVSTAAGQMGLDIDSVDMVTHYSVCHTGVEKVQREGRGGRKTRCKIVSIIVDHPLDWIHYYSSRQQVRTMTLEAKRDRGTLQAESIESAELNHPAIQTSIFSGRPKKESGWVRDIKPGDLIHERFLVNSVRIKQKTKFGPSVWMKLSDKTGTVRLFANCSNIVQAQELTWKVSRAKEGVVHIVIAEARELKNESNPNGETVVVANLRSVDHRHHIVSCPEGDYLSEDYVKNEPPDDF